MTVVKSKRKPSHFRVYGLAEDIRQWIDELCVRNLGIRDPDKIARKKWRIGKDINFEPLRYYYILCSAKENLRLLAYQGQRYVVGAQRIFPRNENEADLRRNALDCAIGTYEMMIREFQHICNVCDVDVNIYVKYTDMIDEEIRLLKSWRKSVNKQL